MEGCEGDIVKEGCSVEVREEMEGESGGVLEGYGREGGGEKKRDVNLSIITKTQNLHHTSLIIVYQCIVYQCIPIYPTYLP